MNPLSKKIFSPLSLTLLFFEFVFEAIWIIREDFKNCQSRSEKVPFHPMNEFFYHKCLTNRTALGNQEQKMSY